MSVLSASASALKRNIAAAAKGQRMLNGRTLAPTVNHNSSAGLKVSSSLLRLYFILSLNYASQVLAVLYKGGEAAKQEPRLLGSVENQLGIREWLESQGHEYIVCPRPVALLDGLLTPTQVTDSKEGPDSVFQKELKDTDILITTPFHPGYLTRDLIKTAPNLKLCVTAGVGSDHIDLNAAVERKIQVLEVTGSNVVSVAEHVMMSILLLVRNFVPAHEVCLRGYFFCL